MTQTAKAFEAALLKTVHLDYLLFLPQGYRKDGDQRWPLILFLHGAGERGSDLERVKKHGIPREVARRPDLPFICVSPQCPAGSTWWNEVDALVALLDHVVATLTVDEDRLYLTGMSMGGYGTWHLATLYPQRFAAIAPICGGGVWMHGYPERVCALKHLPVWAFHGALDPDVPLAESEAMVGALRACGGNVRLTVYSRAGHDSWTRTYAQRWLYDWFLRHRRKPPEAAHEP